MRKVFAALVIITSLLIGSIPAVAYAEATNKPSINTQFMERGIVKINYLNDSSKQIKVMIQKDSDRYTYDLKSNGTDESFPLQMGNGNYTISVLENISGTTYSFLKTESVDVKLANENAVYLSSIQNISWEKGSKVAQKAEELTKGLKSDKEKIKAIYNYVVKNFSYDFVKMANVKTGYIPNAVNTLDTKKGICYDYSSLFAAMARSQGIPTKLVKGYTTNVSAYHAWNEVNVDGKWIIIDTTTDSQWRAAKVSYTMEKSVEEYSKSYEY